MRECGRVPASLGVKRGLKTVWVCKTCLERAVADASYGNTTSNGISVAGATKALAAWPAQERVRAGTARASPAQEA
jgi:ribosomal protein L37AE/L43A